MTRSFSCPRFARLYSLVACSLAAGIVPSRAAAVTTLTVDLSATIGPAKHVASGSLYGVTETLPANVATLITPLHPNMFTNPAADVQQPVGDAIVVAGRIASTGGTVTIRLADWLKGFYTFTSMADWLDKVGQTVSRRKSAGLTNIYGYEIWNEPGGTWSSSNPLSFNDFWKQTYAKLRELDPGIKIIGPSYSYFNSSYINSFLSFCKTNSCVPDIISWHELSGGDLVGNINAYRNIEKQLGIGPLLISINEYSGAARIDVEGQPGASAPIIAKFERTKVDSACISFWDVSHPGRLGSLLATNTDPNGGWWFYKWYGDMTGNMVTTTPPSPTSATALDGFANLDTTNQRASVLFGGTNDGAVQIVVKGFSAASFFTGHVHAVVERTPFTNRTTVVAATSTLSTSDLTVSNDQVAVSVPGVNATDGYRVSLTPVSGGGAANTGGAGGNGGAMTTGGTRSTGGSTSNAGSTSSGGSRTTGGAPATGGTSHVPSTGGATAHTTGGQLAGGGTQPTNTVGALNSGGATTTATAGAPSLGGMPNTGGLSSSATMFGGDSGFDTSTKAVDAGTNTIAGSGDSGGCGCRTNGNSRQNPLWLPAIVGLLLSRAMRRRRLDANTR